MAVKGSSLRFTIKLASAHNLGAGVPTGNDGLTLLQQAKYVVRWDFGKDAYYAGANVAAGGAPSYFSGKVSLDEGVFSPTNPDALFAFGNTYKALGSATGHVSGNSIVIDVPLSAIGSPKAGAEFLSMGTYAMVGPQDGGVILQTLPLTVDSSPTFDARVAGLPRSGRGGSNSGNGGGSSTNGRGAGSLAATGGSEALTATGVVLLLAAAFLRRRHRPT